MKLQAALLFRLCKLERCPGKLSNFSFGEKLKKLCGSFPEGDLRDRAILVAEVACLVESKAWLSFLWLKLQPDF